MMGLLEVAASTTVLDGVITGAMLQGVLDEMIAMLPIVIPVAIAFIGIRKGLSFVFGILHSA